MAWTPATHHTWADGDVLTGANLNSWLGADLTNLNNANGSVTAWTPVLTAATTNPNGYTGSGWYVQNGNVVSAVFNISMGASYTVGSGIYLMSLPIAAATTLGLLIGRARMTGASAAVVTDVNLSTGSLVNFLYQGSLTALALVTHNTPTTWSTGNAIFGSVNYLAA